MRASWYEDAIQSLMRDPRMKAMAREAHGHIPDEPNFLFTIAANEEARRRGIGTGMHLALGSIAEALVRLNQQITNSEILSH